MIINMQEHRPIIETLINTTALALTSFGVVAVTTEVGFLTHLEGYIALGVGMGLEFFKYIGRQKQLW